MNPIVLAIMDMSSVLIRTLVTRGLTRRAFLTSLATQVAVPIGVSELLDEGAKYSTWIKENATYITLASAFLPYGKLAKGYKVVKAGSVLNATKAGVLKLFSKMPLKAALRATQYAISKGSISRMGNAIRVTFANGEYIDIVKTSKEIFFKSHGEFIVPAILAAGFGFAEGDEPSKNPMTSEDLWDTAKQILAVGSDLLTDSASSHIGTQFRKLDALSLLTSLRSVIDSTSSEHPYLETDKIVSIAMSALCEEEEVIGDYVLRGFYDFDDHFVVEVNGLPFVKVKNQFIVKEVRGFKTDKLTPDDELWLELFTQILTFKSADKLELTVYEETQKCVSYPVSLAGKALAIVWDDSTKELYFTSSVDSLFDSASKNIVDDTAPDIYDEAAHSLKGIMSGTRSKWNDIFGSFGSDKQVILTDSHLVKQQIAKGLSNGA